MMSRSDVIRQLKAIETISQLGGQIGHKCDWDGDQPISLSSIDATFRQRSPVATIYISEFDSSPMKMVEAIMLLPKTDEVKHLCWSESDISDSDVSVLVEGPLKSIQHLVLNGTNVTPLILDALEPLLFLRRFAAYNTLIDEHSISMFRKKRTDVHAVACRRPPNEPLNATASVTWEHKTGTRLVPPTNPRGVK